MTPRFTSACMQERRAALRRLTAFLLAGTGCITVGYGKENENGETICVNLRALSPAESKRRKLDNYTEKSSDPAKTCSGCAFFTASARRAACGQCLIFNGAANPNGRCDDWTPRPA
jgi:hypothetical protein